MKKNGAVVQGYDMDSDGKIDYVDIEKVERMISKNIKCFLYS